MLGDHGPRADAKPRTKSAHPGRRNALALFRPTLAALFYTARHQWHTRLAHDHSPDPAYDVGIRGYSPREASRRVMDASAAGRVIDMRSLVMMFAGLVIGVAAIATTAGCTPTASAGQPYACAAGVPWVPDGYTNGKFVPAHCLGQAAQ